MIDRISTGADKPHDGKQQDHGHDGDAPGASTAPTSPIPSPLSGGEIRARQTEWWPRLHFSAGENPKPLLSLENALIILAFEPAFDASRLRFDELAQAVVTRNLPWDDTDEWRVWTDNDDRWLRVWLEQRNLRFRSDIVHSAVDTIALCRAINPVVEYLDNVQWDGIKRLDSLLPDYFGAKADPIEYLRAVGPMMMISAVARAHEPGCKVDHMLVLEGEQGERKSTALRILTGDDWFADQLAEMGTKDAAQDLRGKWIIEDAELAAMRGDKIEKRKAFISRQIDHYRPSYGRRSEDFPRRCIFVATTNDDNYLRDVTGNRRYWPVRVGKIELEALARDRDQLWAEANARYRAGEQWWLPPDLEAVAREVQEQRREADAWEDEIGTYLRLVYADHNPRNGGYATVGDFLAFIGKDPWTITRADSIRVGGAFKAAGLRKVSKVPKSVNPSRPYYYEPKR